MYVLLRENISTALHCVFIVETLVQRKTSYNTAVQANKTQVRFELVFSQKVLQWLEVIESADRCLYISSDYYRHLVCTLKGFQV